MDIDNKKQKRRYIEIQIEDLGEFTDVALLVDNDDFLDEIERMRSKYGMTYAFPAPDTSEVNIIIRNKYFSSPTKNELDADIERIRKLFDRSPHFTPVIRNAIIYGVLTNGVYSKAYLEEQPSFPENNPDGIPETKYCIVIHAGTRDDDVTKVLREFREKVKINFKGNQKEKDNYRFGYGIDLSLKEMTDLHGAIDKIHRWYVSGLKPIEIALAEKGYTKQQHKKLKANAKVLVDNSKLSEVKKRDQDQAKLRNLLSQRDSIKEQLRQYRRLLETSNL